MKVILCSAHYNEISKIIRYFKASLLYSLKKKIKIYRYKKKHDIIYFIIAGMGYKNVKKNLVFFIQHYHLDSSFQWFLTGYAGSLNNENKAGYMIIPNIIKNEKKTFKINLKNHCRLKKNITLFSVDKIYNKHEKQKLKIIFPDADYIDMEAVGFCEVMNEQHFKNFFIFKSITDNLNFKFPAFSLIKDSLLKIPLKRLILVLLKDIKQMKYLYLIYKNMYLASKWNYNFFIKFYEKNSGK